MLRRATTRLRKSVRRYIAHPKLQQPYRLLYRIALMGMNYGGAGSYLSAGDELALERVANRRDRSKPAVIFDVGANVGSYAKQALQICGADSELHAFEPSRAAFTRLVDVLSKWPRAKCVNAGIGATRGTAKLWSDSPGSVLASTYVNPTNANTTAESIDIITLDDYCAEHGIDRIDLLKLDLEGGEVDALRGAQRLLAAGSIDLIQFEFGQPSLGARTYFVDLFELLHPQFEIYRVLPKGLERLAGYHETLEVFMSTNYLAVSTSTR